MAALSNGKVYPPREGRYVIALHTKVARYTLVYFAILWYTLLCKTREKSDRLVFRLHTFIYLYIALYSFTYLYIPLHTEISGI